MLVTTTVTNEGRRITRYKSVACGIIVRALTICPKGFFGGLKNVVGGGIGAYMGMCEQV